MTSGPVRGTLPDPPDLVSGEVPLRVMLVLSAADKETLMQAEKKNPDWRVRERARSVLLLAQGKTCAQVAALQELSMRTVSCQGFRFQSARRSTVV